MKRKTPRKKSAPTHRLQPSSGAVTPKAPHVEDPSESSARTTLPIVGIGASAGGLEAFSQLLRELPTDTGMAFVLVQHLDPKHQSQLPEVLSRTTAMPVLTVTDRLRAAPDHST
jgi:two-component system CheB/CheR fusion protein